MNDIKPPRGCGDLATWLAWQESAHPKSWDLGLTRINQVWQALGAPRIADTIITTAGTNGKGSCVVWGENICLTHGISVASFSSPHLLDYRERIRFDGEAVNAETLCRAFDAVDCARGDISLTYFEWSALAAFYLMAQRRPQVAMLEVGLGGRLDAVNLLDADAAVFTRIGLDHQDWLGDTVEKIASEKAGIMRPNQRVVFADSYPPKSLLHAAQKHHVQLWRYGHELNVQEKADGILLSIPQDEFHLPYPQFMHGTHQYGQLAAVTAVLGEHFSLQESALIKAVETAKHLARLMFVNTHPRAIVDVAHNPDSAEILADFLATQPPNRYHIVCGMLNDKDHAGVFSALDDFASHWYLASLSGDRGTPASVLAEHAYQAGVNSDKIQIFDTVIAALVAANTACIDDSDTVVVMGSFVTVGQALHYWNIHE